MHRITKQLQDRGYSVVKSPDPLQPVLPELPMPSPDASNLVIWSGQANDPNYELLRDRFWEVHKMDLIIYIP